jgi:hypothetical protein
MSMAKILEPAVVMIGRKSVGPVSFAEIAVIETGRVVTHNTVATTATAFMNLNRHPVPGREFIDGIAQGDDGAGIFMADDKFSHGRLVGHAVRNDLNVRAADPAGFNIDQDLVGTRQRDLTLFNPHIIEGVKNGGFHFFRNIHDGLLA